MIQKNQEYDVTIVDLTYEGMGVAKIDHYPLFIENTLPGEEVRIKVLKVGKKFGFGKVVEFYKTSPDRIPSEEKKWTQTGIAPLQHMRYDAQLAFKKRQVEECLHKMHCDEVEVHDTTPSPQQMHYRNKAQVPVRVIDGKMEVGFYRKNSHQFIAIQNFGIQQEDIDDALQVIARILTEFGVSAYNEERHEGVLRHIIVRQGYYSKEMMVTLVTRKKKLFQGQQIAQRIIEEIPTVVSVMQNINDQKTNVIMGENTICLAGKERIEDEMLGHTFQISAPSFYQVNTPQAEAMYQKAIDLAHLSKDMIAIDAYCGIGTITLSIAPYVKEIYGVEVVAPAIDNAKENAKENEMTNVHFAVGKAEEVLSKWQEEGIQPDVVFVDPPRKGLARSFVETTIELAPEKIAYISCNPATFARDVALFKEAGYRLDEVYPYDMFPQTTHVECVGVLYKQN